MPSVQPRTRYTAAPSPPSKTVSGDAHRIPGERRIYACRPKTARRSPSSPRARRAASCLQLDDRLDGRALESNLVDALEERELVLDALVFEHHHHVLASDRALQLLPVELVSLDLVPRAFLPREGLGALAVAAAVAGGDQVGDAAALEERVVADAVVGVEGLAKLDHLLEPNADDRRLGVAAVPKPVDEARADRHNVLERAAQLDSDRVLDGADLEREVVVGKLEERAVRRVLVTNGRLAEGVACHVVRDVRAHEHRAIGAQLLADDIGDEHDAVLVKVNALDGREALGARGSGRLDGGHHRLEELVGQAEADHRRARDRRRDVRVGHHVRRELGILQVLDVLVVLVDQLGQRHTVNHLLVHVHLDLIVKDVVAQRVAAKDAHERRAEVARADHGDLLGELAAAEAQAAAVDGAKGGQSGHC
mmetsp:Transcript_3951/g.10382  ORF Transcript_3951/g.10382 Transcript_3951/m.10382 type:complete len:422 (-) Transcript_3951:19-1284(-)